MNAKMETDWVGRGKRNTVNLAIWTSAWVLTKAVVSFGPKLIWDFNDTISLIGIIINTAIGIGMINANRIFLNNLDELQKRIQLEAMGITLGLGVVGGLSYSMLDVSNVIQSDAEISILVMGLAICYLVSVGIGQLRYK